VIRGGRIGSGIRRSSEERDQERDPDHEWDDRAGGGDAVYLGSDDGVDSQYHPERGDDRAEHVDLASEPEPMVARQHIPADEQRDGPDRHVDEEDPVPADQLGEHAAEDQSEGSAGDTDERVDAHRAGALLRVGNSITISARIAGAAIAAPDPWMNLAMSSTVVA
jgi:hypothetical protein